MVKLEPVDSAVAFMAQKAQMELVKIEAEPVAVKQLAVVFTMALGLLLDHLVKVEIIKTVAPVEPVVADYTVVVLELVVIVTVVVAVAQAISAILY